MITATAVLQEQPVETIAMEAEPPAQPAGGDLAALHGRVERLATGKAQEHGGLVRREPEPVLERLGACLGTRQASREALPLGSGKG